MSTHLLDSPVLTVGDIDPLCVYHDRLTGLQIRATERNGEMLLCRSAPWTMLGGQLDMCGVFRVEYWCHASRMTKLSLLQANLFKAEVQKFGRCNR